MAAQYRYQADIAVVNAGMLYGARVLRIISVLITTKQIILQLVGLLHLMLIKVPVLFLVMLGILS